MRILMYYLIAINVITWIIYGLDKWKARKGKQRIPERTLLLFTAAGGSVGAIAGILMFRHKTRKAKFVVAVPVMLVVHCVLVGMALERLF